VEYTAAEPQFPFTYARWPRRIGSAVIDFLVITVLSVPFLAPTLSRVVDESTEANPATFTAGEIRSLTIITIAVQIVYFTGMHAWRGATVGKMATRTVLVRDEGQPVTFGVAFTRAVTLVGINFISGFLLLIPAIVNMLSPLWSPQRQTLHDRLAKTIVVLRET
jgi:uncharacterized RDD family membrane protein YckC